MRRKSYRILRPGCPGTTGTLLPQSRSKPLPPADHRSPTALVIDLTKEVFHACRKGTIRSRQTFGTASCVEKLETATDTGVLPNEAFPGTTTSAGANAVAGTNDPIGKYSSAPVGVVTQSCAPTMEAVKKLLAKVVVRRNPFPKP